MTDPYRAGTGDLYRCDTCGDLFNHRAAGDMADLNNMCRMCAEQCAHQLEVDYNLPEGCSDADRQAALGDGNPNLPHYVYRCDASQCIASGKTWSTQLTRGEWQTKYGRDPHCFRCGGDSNEVRVQWISTGGA